MRKAEEQHLPELERQVPSGVSVSRVVALACRGGRRHRNLAPPPQRREAAQQPELLDLDAIQADT